MPARMSFNKRIVDPYAGLSDVLSNFQTQITAEEKLASEVARQKILDDRYQAGVGLAAERQVVEDTRYTAGVDLAADKYKDALARQEQADAIKGAEINLRLQQQGKENVRADSREAREVSRRADEVRKRKDTAAYINAFTASEDMRVAENPLLRSQVDIKGMPVPENVMKSFDAAIKAVDSEQPVSEFDKAVIDEFNAATSKIGSGYLEEKGANFGERMVGIGDKLRGNVAYGTSMLQKGAADEIAANTVRAQANKNLQDLYVAQAKAGTGTGKTVLGSKVNTTVASTVYKNLGFSAKNPAPANVKKAVVKAQGSNYGVNQILGALGAHYSAREKGWVWDTEAKLDPVAMEETLAKQVKENEVVGGGENAAITERIKTIEASLKTKDGKLASKDYNDYIKAIKQLDEARGGVITPQGTANVTVSPEAKVTKPTISVFESTPTKRSPTEIRDAILEANRNQEFEKSRALRKELKVAELNKEELQAALLKANTSGNKDLAANIRLMISNKK